MDPGGIGALIGVGSLFGVFLCMKLYDFYSKRPRRPSLKTPLIVVKNSKPIMIVRQHSKMNLILPKKI
jgi:hypothetical protein